MSRYVVFMLVTYLFTGSVTPSPAPAHDPFQWWAEIVIPAFVGLATVAVSFAAVWVSSRATRLAKAVEDQRVNAEEERVRDSARSRLQGMALEEARFLHRWVVESMRASLHYFPAKGNDQRAPLEQAKVDAQVELEQSIVPGAAELFELTELDISQRYPWVDPESQGARERQAALESNLERRNQRTIDRIREWALDPEYRAPLVSEELRQAKHDLNDYLLFGEGIEGVPPV